MVSALVKVREKAMGKVIDSVVGTLVGGDESVGGLVVIVLACL